jgi:hypothetical protein
MSGATKSMQLLLGYPLRKAAAKEMLYGGARVIGLVAPPPPIQKTFSEKTTLPTLDEERQDMQLDFTEVTRVLTPNNLHARSRQSLAFVKSKDLLRNYEQMKKPFHTPSRDLSITPMPHDEWLRKSDRQREFLPVASMKPANVAFGTGDREGGLRPASSPLRHERLDRKGFGYKKKQYGLWQQDTNTQSFTPERGY